MGNELELVQHTQIEGLNLFVVQVEYRTPHLHRDFELDLVLEGEADFLSGGMSCHVGAGDFILIHPNQPHEIKSTPAGVTVLCLQIHPHYFLQAVPAMETLQFENAFPLGKISRESRKRLNGLCIETAMLYIRRPRYYELECLGYLHFLVAHLLGILPVRQLSPSEWHVRQKKMERIAKLLDFVDMNYRQKIRLSDFAAMESVSMTHLSHFIKETLNQTFQDYVTMVRFNQARKLLLSSGKRIIDICLESGFSDPRYLTQAFVRNTGLRPDEYRRQYHGDHLAGEAVKVHRSLHSSQRYFSAEKSIAMLEAHRERV